MRSKGRTRRVEDVGRGNKAEKAAEERECVAKKVAKGRRALDAALSTEKKGRPVYGICAILGRRGERGINRRVRMARACGNGNDSKKNWEAGMTHHAVEDGHAEDAFIVVRHLDVVGLQAVPLGAESRGVEGSMHQEAVQLHFRGVCCSHALRSTS